MTTVEDPTRHTLTDLAIGSSDALAFLFTQLRARLQRELAEAIHSGGWDKLREEWIGTRDSVKSRIIENWLRNGPIAFKPYVIRGLKNLIDEVFILAIVTRPLDQLRATTVEHVGKLFQNLRVQFDQELNECINEVDLGVTRTFWLGRSSGILTHVTNDWLKSAPPNLKRTVGSEFNKFKAYVETEFDTRLAAIEAGADEVALTKERVDLSLPGVVRPVGSHHLIRQVFQEIEDIFVSVGFSVVEGPEIETPYYNFEALNIPEFHPVRDDMDTFYLELPKGAATPLLLRTHTSPMQIRTMEKRKPPVRVIVPGKVYRRDNPDATHSFAFHQIEGLAVDTDITFCDFTGTIEYFVKQFFGPSVKTRFRPSYFPFTEPSVEFDVSCPFCGGTGTAAGGGTCSKCKGAAWIELFGAGMVDPAVYGFVNYDAKKVSGFAFGIGIDRLAMLKYGIDDIQVFFQNDVRFLRQFP
jgi:phenylalanyl-tRNA synthetase alpha chain